MIIVVIVVTGENNNIDHNYDNCINNRNDNINNDNGNNNNSNGNNNIFIMILTFISILMFIMFMGCSDNGGCGGDDDSEYVVKLTMILVGL